MDPSPNVQGAFLYPTSVSHLDCIFANLTLNDEKYIFETNSISFKLASTVIFTPKQMLLGFKSAVYNFQHHHLDLPASFRDLDENAAGCSSCVWTAPNHSEF